MPALTLRIVSVDAAPVERPASKTFETSGGSIGRDETNLFALPDVHRRVSRLHATISFPGGQATITNASTSLPLSVGEQQLDGGESMPVVQGALIEIGPYILQAHLADSERELTVSSGGMAAMPTGSDLQRLAATAMSPNLPVAASVMPAMTIREAPSPTPKVEPPTAALPQSFGDDLLAFHAPSHAADVPSRQATLPPLLGTQGPAVATPNNVARQAIDPFADLLAGIGGTPAQVTNAQEVGSADPFADISGVQPPQPRAASPSPQSSSGLSLDPMAAFGGSAYGSSNSFSGAARVPGHNLASGSVAGNVSPGSELDPFQLPSSSSRNSSDPLAHLLGITQAEPLTSFNAVPGGSPSIDSLFQSENSGNADFSDPLLFGQSASTRADRGSLDQLIGSNAESDPLALFAAEDALSSITEPVLRPMRDDRVEVGSAFTPPLASQAFAPQVAILPEFEVWSNPPAAAPAQPVASPHALQPTPPIFAAVSVPSPVPILAPAPIVAPVIALAAPVIAAPDELTAAFLRGAGLQSSALPQGLSPEIMTVIGSLLRSATAGAVDMLAARAATKREVQASVTIISVQANNPLKFLPDADSALRQLLGKKMPGFMRADVAMRDAFDDLRAHEVGVIAGTRAALTEVLGKFDPAILADKLVRGSVLESLMPSARKAKLWDLYLERYQQIRREAEDDFQSIFGRAFVQAYERETARIKGEPSMGGGER
jgi:FHA domain-containing protein